MMFTAAKLLALMLAVAAVISVGTCTEATSCSDGCLHGSCDEATGSCRCQAGWEGSACDKCVRKPGCHEGICDAPNECKCKPGFTGDLCDQVDNIKNYCVTFNPCQNNATCTPAQYFTEKFTCTCLPGFTGKTCGVKIASAKTSRRSMLPILRKPSDKLCNKGFCGKYKDEDKKVCEQCVCPKGYHGKFCQNQIFKKVLCDSSLCGEGQNCYSTGAKFDCFCSSGLAGKKCRELKKREEGSSCENKSFNPCQNGGRCVNSQPSYKCHCTDMFTGSRCQYPVEKNMPVRVASLPVVVEPSVEPLPYTQEVPSKAPLKNSEPLNLPFSSNQNYDPEVYRHDRPNSPMIELQAKPLEIHIDSVRHQSTSSSPIRSICFVLVGFAFCLMISVVGYVLFVRERQRREKFQQQQQRPVRRDGDGEEYQLREPTTHHHHQQHVVNSKQPMIIIGDSSLVIESEQQVLVSSRPAPPQIPSTSTSSSLPVGKLSSLSQQQHPETKSLLAGHHSSSSSQQHKTHIGHPPPPISSTDLRHEVVDLTTEDDEEEDNFVRRHYLPDVTIV